jgi:hypothetical protein
MSLYIQTENQKLLWEMIQKTSQFSQVFANSPQQKELWFKNVIAEFHNKTPMIKNRDELVAINRQTLSYMMNQLTNAITPSPPTKPTEKMSASVNAPPNPNYSVGNVPTTAYSRNQNTTTTSREEIYKRQFEEREREYKAMSAAPEPPKVNFKETEDSVISNMAELVEQHRKMRELDSQTLPPSTEITRLKLAENLPTEMIESDAVVLEESEMKKRIKWADIEISDSLNQQLENLKCDFNKELEILKTDIKEIKEMVSKIANNIP